MHVVTRRRLLNFAAVHPNAEIPLDAWYRWAKRSTCSSFAELRAEFGSRVDQYGPLQIFDIGGNKYRLIVRMNFVTGKVFIRHVLTHSEYSRGKWKSS